MFIIVVIITNMKRVYNRLPRRQYTINILCPLYSVYNTRILFTRRTHLGKERKKNIILYSNYNGCNLTIFLLDSCIKKYKIN